MKTKKLIEEYQNKISECDSLIKNEKKNIIKFRDQGLDSSSREFNDSIVYRDLQTEIKGCYLRFIEELRGDPIKKFDYTVEKIFSLLFLFLMLFLILATTETVKPFWQFLLWLHEH